MLVSWNTTNQCNMACTHCYRDAGAKAEEELSTAEAKQLIDELALAGFKIMIFSGGEPLMRPDIFELVEYARSTGLRPVFGTNGSLITPETAVQLKQSGAMAMGISLDSLNQERHDAFRGLTGAWRQTVEGMKNCRAAGLPFQIHTTVFDWNQSELEAITDFAVEIGAMAHHIFFLIPVGRGKAIEDSMLPLEDYEDLLARIMRKQAQVPIELKPTCAPQFMRIAEQEGIETRFQRGCLAGISYCIINPLGKVQPCAYMDLEIGNVREMPFHEIWQNDPTLLKLRSLDYGGKCGHCRYIKKCGGCRARAVYEYGDFMAEDVYCSYSNLKQEKGKAL